MCAITGLIGFSKVGKVGQGLKRDVCGYEEDACMPSYVDQVHVSGTRSGDSDAVLCGVDSLGSSNPVVVPEIDRTTLSAYVSPSTSRKTMTKAPPKKVRSLVCWMFHIHRGVPCGPCVPCGTEHSSNSLTHFEGLRVLPVFQCRTSFGENHLSRATVAGCSTCLRVTH